MPFLALRTFTTSALLSAKTAAKPSKKSKTVSKKILADEKKLKSLKAKLAREKKTLKDITKKQTELSKKHKEIKASRKSAASEKALLAKATKTFKKVTGFNVFVKEQTLESKQPLASISPLWKALAEAEKDVFKDKADAINTESLKLYKPKPKRPTFGYAQFIKENWLPDRSFAEGSKELSEEWKQLSDGEKSRYAIDKSALEAYKAELAKWTEERVQIYKSKSA